MTHATFDSGAQWTFLDASLADSAFHVHEPLAIALGEIQDYRDQLHAEEMDELGKMAPARQLGFAAGRHCAHICQTMLDRPVEAIGRKARVPQWPLGIVGSITHSDTIAAALASTVHGAVGIDIEQAQRVEQKLFSHLFTPWEQAQIESAGGWAASIMFSAKEAGYKATYTLGQKFIGFKDAEIHLQANNQFKIDYIGKDDVNRVANSGSGYWGMLGEHVLTVFVIPAV